MINNRNILPAQPFIQKKQQSNGTSQNQYANSGIVNVLFERQFLFIKEPKQFIIYLGILGLIFLVIAIATLVLTVDTVDLQVFYARQRKCIQSGLESPKCSVKFNVTQDMKGPVYLLYSVKNLYVNHRRFLDSYSMDQLNGKAISADFARKSCGQFVFNKNIPENKSWTGQPLNPNDIASLCGAKPQGYLNDTFKIFQKGKQIAIDQSNIYKGIAISSHRGPNSQETQWIDPQNQHFKLYMLDGSLLTKRRLWGVIKDGLKTGQYQLLATNNFQMAEMKIQKHIFLTTTTIIGGKQILYPIMFGICSLMCFGYLIFIRIYFSDYDKIKEYDKIYK